MQPGAGAGASVAQRSMRRPLPCRSGPGRFLNGAFGRDGDWLLIPATVALVGILVTRRRAPRTDALRAAAVLWAAWLFLTWCFFASSHFINSYYLAALAPPIAALCGLGLALAWQLRDRRTARAVVGGTVVASTAYALYLLPSDAGVRPWILVTTLLLAVTAVAVAAVVALAATTVVDGAGRRRPVRRRARGRFRVGLGHGGGGPARPLRLALPAGQHLGPRPGSQRRGGRHRRGARACRGAASTRAVSVITLETSAGSSVPILATGHEFLPVGGFTGRVPTPTLARFIDDVCAGQGGRGAGGRVTADPQSRPALGHGPLSPPALPRTRQSHRGAERWVSSPVRRRTRRVEPLGLRLAHRSAR